MENKRTWIWIGLGVLVLATLVTALPWILNFHNHLWSDDPAHWGQFGDYIGGTLATILAALSFGGLMLNVIQQNQAMRKEWQLRDDESYNRQAIVCLERAFEAITDDQYARPKTNRQAWIDCARLLLAAQELGTKIKSDGFKAMYGSELAHWRRKFYDLFDPEKIFSASKAPTFYIGYKLEPNSVYAIYSFINWPEEEPDALSQIKTTDWDISKIPFFFPNQGAKAFLLMIKDKYTAE
ncbi:hypothetical protein [Pseudomonas sp. BN515]|uniref:hypothetical protein n=1 Tax=Pseudomonas sp. BN515 TaxID=2567892 RepID=UPI00245729AC|nr:hypothetical protein [Pseudomonas sp. BN515]MDH4872897.1 hypothetical protein [Pseudomonas sp. BN515]